MDIFGSQPISIRFFFAMEKSVESQGKAWKCLGSSVWEGSTFSEGWQFPGDHGDLWTKLLPLSHDCMLGMGGTCTNLWAEQKSLDGRRKTWPKLQAFWWSWIPSFFRRHYTRFFGESIVDSEIWKDLNVEDPLENLVWNYEWEVVEGWLQKNSWKSLLEKKQSNRNSSPDFEFEHTWWCRVIPRGAEEKKIPITQELNGHKEHCGYMIPGFFNARIETCRYDIHILLDFPKCSLEKNPKKTQPYGPPWIIPLRFLSPMRRKVSKITVKLAEWIPPEFPGAMMCHNDETPVPKNSGSKRIS